jgi:DNA-binding CsgD family transcriptional regulator
MLANSTMALVQKNNMLGELKAVIAKDDLTKTNDAQYKRRLINLIDRNIDSDEDWEIFERNFAEVHEDFLEKLKTNDITAGELKLAAYIRMNLSSKEIAPLLNISIRSVENKRYRLRKKMGIEHDDNLSEHLLRM